MISRLFAALGIASLLLANAACSGAADTGATDDSTEQDLKTNKTCGGFAGLTCPSGYVCEMSGPIFPDKSGTCQKGHRLTGSWGADQASLTTADGGANLEFGCASATIDPFWIGPDGKFSATGTHTAGSGIMFAPGTGPKPVPATFSGEVHGDQMTLDMIVEGGQPFEMDFTKGRQSTFMHCM
jgi:hypothetical protein